MGIYLEKFNADLQADATVEADYAYYNEPAQRWTLRGNVKAINLEGEMFETPLLYWDQKSESVYSDSAIVITSTDKTEKAEMLRALRSQLKDAPETELKSWFYIPNRNAITSQYVQFYVNPSYIETEYTYNKEKKKAYFVFYSNAYTGIWSPTDHTFQYQMGLYAICLDKLELNGEHTITSPYLREVYITCEAK